MAPSFGLLGNGAQARETAEFALPDRVAFRAVAAQYRLPDDVDTIDIASQDPSLLATPVVVGVGAPAVKAALVDSWAGTMFRTVQAASAVVSPSAHLGAGVILAPGVVVSSDATIGDHVLLNLGVTVSHDTAIGDFVTLSPGVHVAGRCRIGAGTFIGIGAVVSHGISIANGTVIGAGAVVISDIRTPGVYVGVPAVRLRDQKGWLDVV